MSRGRRFRTKSKFLNWILDWVDAILFAVVVVTLINTFWFQAFKIPSSSMESTLLTGDHLFVSKLTYGARLPMTPLTIPFTHNTIGSKESYSAKVQWKYRRLKGLGQPRRGDVIVFGFPNGDTVLTKAPSEDYYSLCRMLGRDRVQELWGPVRTRPMDKKDHYVKRCVAVPGDTLSVRNGLVYIDGVQQETYPGLQLSYRVVTTGGKFNSKIIEKLGLNASELYFDGTLPGYPAMVLTAGMLETVKSMGNVVSVEANLDTVPEGSDGDSEVFPFRPSYGWTRDSYGPLWIPSKGSTVPLDDSTLPIYERIITSYEGHTLSRDADGRIMIDGKAAGDYTFAQDYYFMMGDNRHNSLDSRYWGFVPYDHIVGRPVVIWLSTDGNRSFPQNIRWKRFLKFV